MPRILIIDDEAPIRDLLSRYLSSNGFTVSPAGSAAAAMKDIEQASPDLVISDLQLEDADGLELIGRIKERFPQVPVILLTGALFEPDVVEHTLRDKVNRYLPKTSSLGLIVSTVRELLPPR
jgi:CheY-like chemotaxis protein